MKGGSRREGGAAAQRAQAAAVQVGSIRAALSQHARRHSQHLQSAAPPRLPIHTAHFPSGSYSTVAQRCRGGMTPGEFRLSNAARSRYRDNTHRPACHLPRNSERSRHGKTRSYVATRRGSGTARRQSAIRRGQRGARMSSSVPMHKVAALQPAARGNRREAGSQLRGRKNASCPASRPGSPV